MNLEMEQTILWDWIGYTVSVWLEPQNPLWGSYPFAWEWEALR